MPLFVLDDGVAATGFAVPNRAAILAGCLADLGVVLRSAHLARSAEPEDSGPEGVITPIERHLDQLGPAPAGNRRP